MKKICAEGFQASSVDIKALSHYLLDTPATWGNSALRGMINKAVKTILRDWFEVYKSKQTGTVPGDVAIIIPAIIAMEEFKPYNRDLPDMPIVERTEVASEEIWEGGFDVEDYQKQALEAYYSDHEAMLRYFMENKIFQRRKAFVKEQEKGFFDRKEAIPVKQDDFINAVCAKPGYKNRAQQESEMQI